jgi:ABC-type phosphate transport system substrate-binding protein
MAPLLLLLLLLPSPQQALGQPLSPSTVLSLHGSGTTNPKKLHWELMSRMEAMAGLPVELSYRAIGSSSGKVEFLANASAFGCAEIPVLESEKLAGQAVLQLPLVLGAMSVFHHTGSTSLELTPCMLARIFSRQITRWDDSGLREGGVNSGLATVQLAITVLHRQMGSSTTNFFTKYLHEATRASCPSAWLLGWGPALTTQADVARYNTVSDVWPAQVTAVEGSGEMSSRIASTEGSIGYLDSGHGVDDGLDEVRLMNLAGNFVHSQQVGAAGVMAAADAVAMPAADGNWEAVDLINQAGEHSAHVITRCIHRAALSSHTISLAVFAQ